jgi:hypothetical protein
MKWELASIERYIEAKEYIDTALIPLIQVKLEDDLKLSLADSSWVLGVAGSIEEQLTGRVMLFPQMSYTGHEEEVHIISTLNTYALHIEQYGFKNVIFLTHNNSWEAKAEQLIAKILDIPREKPDSLDFSTGEIKDYAQKIVPRIIGFWK